MIMNKILTIISLLTLMALHSVAQSEFKPLFDEKLNNALYPAGVWSVTDGVLTATDDQAIWSSKVYRNFELEVEFKTAEGTNSGIIIYCSDIKNWIPNSLEVQIADDFSEEWSKSPATWHCGAIFGRLAPSKSVVRKPGLWNSFKITVVDRVVTVVLNDETVAQMDVRKWADAKKNPDGSDIPAWLSKPAASLPDYGHIGFQGKHAGAPIYFRNARIREL